MSTQHDAIKAAYETYLAENEKFTSKGVKASAARARKALQELGKALKERRIASAGLDVFEGEPKVHPDLLTVPNVVLTPHIASATMATRLKMAQLAADNLIAFFEQGRAITPLNEVSA